MGSQRKTVGPTRQPESGDLNKISILGSSFHRIKNLARIQPRKLMKHRNLQENP
jgi:hypothetical protein